MKKILLATLFIFTFTATAMSMSFIDRLSAVVAKKNASSSSSGTASVVNNNSGVSSSTTVDATLGGTATAGNLIIIAIDAADQTGGTPTGYTLSDQCALGGYAAHYLYWKIATGGETGVQYTINSATNSAWVMIEIDGLTSSPYDDSLSQGQEGEVASYATPDITPTSGERYLVAAIGGNGYIEQDITGWSDSFSQIDIAANTDGDYNMIAVAGLQVTANGATSYSTTASYYTGAGNYSTYAIIIAFKVE